MKRLSFYFDTERGQLDALKAAESDAWLDPLDNVVLYTLSSCAFDCGLPKEEAQKYFDNIYHRLSEVRWGVFRPAGRDSCWKADKIFQTIQSEFRGLSRSSTINLLNFVPAETDNN